MSNLGISSSHPSVGADNEQGEMTLSGAMETGSKLLGAAGGGYALYEDFTKGLGVTTGIRPYARCQP